ncbi:MULTISPECIES: FAD-dependent monooxygenase [unclassified Mycobacterium]|uniref:FAD-dependent monooxygenase n=1 Tax=unclassified Mycobacterium TaxID=2642494 RepID=UPI0029C807E2|nr:MULTISPECIES: FAD-dependent monooxygenase [unclassified Mycobacterium]
MTRLDIIGGGPAGAFTARLAALRYPDWEVRLFERLAPDDTFGFGVGLTHALLEAVHKADPAIHQRLLAATLKFSSAEFRVDAGTTNFLQFHSGAIRRSELLRILLEGAADAGAEVNIGSVVHVDDVREGADIVVGADGLSSSTRTRFEPQFGVTTTLGRGVFIWCAADIELEGTVFQPVDTPAGTFVMHAYPYSKGLSTFVIEASLETIERAGFTDRDWTSDGASDDEALDYLSEAFAKVLMGARFFGNRSRWSHFTTLQCRNWSYQNVVLIGDAVATVHPSLGSGTKVAMESAIALVDQLKAVGSETPHKVLLEYTRSRRRQVQRLQDRAQRSQLWWESFTNRKEMSAPRLAFAYLSRAGVVSLDRLAATDPALVAQAAADFSGAAPTAVPSRDLTPWVLRQPFDTTELTLPTRVLASGVDGATPIEVTSGDAWGPDGDDYVRQVRNQLQNGTHVVTLTGGNDRGAIMDRLAVAERVKLETHGVVAIRASADHDDLVADGILAGRADLVQLDSDA